jgi:hypothetical protein
MLNRYISHDDYMAAVAVSKGTHWKNAASRWDYHRGAIEFVRQANPAAPSDVLEMGTMGVSIVKGSDTIDYAEKWNHAGPPPTFMHDARHIPWPIADKRYQVFVALRVFHHLWPKQRECFEEARRIARHIVMVVPERYEVPTLRDTSVGISAAQLTEWNDGVPPTACVPLADWIGKIYYWNEEALRPR